MIMDMDMDMDIDIDMDMDRDKDIDMDMGTDTDTGHRRINCKFEYFSEFEFIFETALLYESGDWGTCFDEKKPEAKFLVSVSL
jgi:hypothetical protein